MGVDRFDLCLTAKAHAFQGCTSGGTQKGRSWAEAIDSNDEGEMRTENKHFVDMGRF